MKVKQYIVTYNNEYQINKCIDSIYDNLSDDELSMLDITVISNHSNLILSEINKKRVNVLMNDLRPDFSTGHLARNWNQCIINGFVSLKNPACDILITCQDDTEFQLNYISQLIDLHKKYSFIQLGSGDACISYTPSSVIKIGLWDERFCNIGHQEADYFLRAYLYNNEHSSINDPHGKYLNQIDHYAIIKNTVSGCDRQESYHIESQRYHHVSHKVYNAKWGFLGVNNWLDEAPIISNPLINSFILYPYFEKDISYDSLVKQKYIF